jgi:hypothetical protein
MPKEEVLELDQLLNSQFLFSNDLKNKFIFILLNFKMFLIYLYYN